MTELLDPRTLVEILTPTAKTTSGYSNNRPVIASVLGATTAKGGVCP